MKKIILFISICAIGICFPVGTKTIGGSTGITVDFNDDDQTFYFNPRGGIFVYNNILVEGGLYYNHYKDGDVSNFNGYVYDYSYTQYSFTFGARYFLNNTYAGLMYQGNPHHSEYNIDDQERMHLKIGMLTPIATNIYLDYNIDYYWYLKNDDDDGIMRIECGVSYFWN